MKPATPVIRTGSDIPNLHPSASAFGASRNSRSGASTRTLLSGYFPRRHERLHRWRHSGNAAAPSEWRAARGHGCRLMRYCTKCVYPAVAATPLTFDANGVCSGCRIGLNKVKIDWDERRKLFLDLLDQYRTESEYDCILPVSGGKDSYRAAHIAKEFGL